MVWPPTIMPFRVNFETVPTATQAPINPDIPRK